MGPHLYADTSGVALNAFGWQIAWWRRGAWVPLSARQIPERWFGRLVVTRNRTGRQ